MVLQGNSIRYLSDHLAPFMLAVFQESLLQGELPNSLKQGDITP